MPYDPAILLLSIYLNKTKKNSKNTYTFMFMAALFIIVKIWKQPRCASAVNVWTRCGTYVAFCGNMNEPRGYYATLNKSDKDKYCMISLVCESLKQNKTEADS